MPKISPPIDYLDNSKISLEIMFDEELNLYHRGPGDLGVIKQQSDYKELTKLDLSGGAILNLGAHIGLFERYMLKNSNAEQFISVEPDPNNLRVLRLNVGAETEIIPQAVVDDGSRSVKLYLGRTYPSCNSTQPVRGRKTITVHTIRWTTLLANNPIAVKCDIEGAEYNLRWNILPSSVRAVAFEFHQQRKEWIPAMWNIHKQLIGNGFICLKRPKVNAYSKVCPAVYSR